MKGRLWVKGEALMKWWFERTQKQRVALFSLGLLLLLTLTYWWGNGIFAAPPTGGEISTFIASDGNESIVESEDTTSTVIGLTPKGDPPHVPAQTIGVGWVRWDDIWLISQVIHGEARGEPYVGQVAVGAVLINRVKHPSFPNTVAGVVFQPYAFTAVDDGQIWLPPDQTAIRAAQDAVAGWDPTGGCIYYFNPATATSPWIWSRPQILQIGRHIFTY